MTTTTTTTKRLSGARRRRLLKPTDFWSTDADPQWWRPTDTTSTMDLENVVVVVVVLGQVEWQAGDMKTGSVMAKRVQAIEEVQCRRIGRL